MSLNSASINSISINGEASFGVTSFTGDAIMVFDQTVAGFTGSVTVSFDQVVRDTGNASIIFDQSVAFATGDAVLAFVQSIVQAGNADLSLSQNVYDPIVVASDWQSWDISVRVGGIDKSTDLVDALTIEAERSAARTAEFTVLLSGVVNPLEWVGQTVQIDYTQNTGATWRRFTGVIERAQYDIAGKTLQCTCTDELQRVIDGYSNLQLQELTGGYWSKHVFNADNIGWDYLNDLLKTVTKSVDLNSNRQLIVSDLQNKTTPDYTFDENLILDESLSVEMVQLNQLVNRVDVAFQTRYERLFHREETIHWGIQAGFCELFENSIDFPNRSMVESAIGSSEWRFMNASFTPIWPTGFYFCSGMQVGFINNFPEGMRGFDARVGRRWNQTVTDEFKISVSAPDSVTAYGGERIEDISASAEFETAFPDWGSDGEDLTVLPPGMVADGDGNIRMDEAGDVEINDALKTLVAQAISTIHVSHGKNAVNFQMPLAPYIELDQTVQTIDTEVTAKGIVQRFTETYSFDTGTPITEIELAISAGGSGLDRVVIAVGVAGRAPLEEGDFIYKSNTLDTRIGGSQNSPPENEDWLGMILNESTPFIGSNTYTPKLKIRFDAIDDANRLNDERLVEQQIKIAVPDNILTQTA